MAPFDDGYSAFGYAYSNSFFHQSGADAVRVVGVPVVVVAVGVHVPHVVGVVGVRGAEPPVGGATGHTLGDHGLADGGCHIRLRLALTLAGIFEFKLVHRLTSLRYLHSTYRYGNCQYVFYKFGQFNLHSGK